MRVSIEKPGTPAELVHYGKKGMRWGYTTTRNIGTGLAVASIAAKVIQNRSAAKQADQQLYSFLKVGNGKDSHSNAVKDMKWHSDNFEMKGFNLVKNLGNISADRGVTKAISDEVSAVSKPELKTLRKSGLSRLEYNDKAVKIYMKNVRKIAPKHESISPSGNWKTSFSESKNGWNMKVVRNDNKIKHADNLISTFSLDSEVTFVPIYDNEGYIIDFDIKSLSDNAMTQGETFVKNFLAHNK